MTTKTRKTWKQKIGKRLLAHAKETTQRCTLREVKANVAHQQATGTPCFECNAILIKAGV